MQLAAWILANGLLLLAVWFVLLVPSALLIPWVRAVARERRAAQVAREALGKPLGDLPETTGAAVTLAGTLRVRGEPCLRPGDGAAAAAVTVVGSKKRYGPADEEPTFDLGGRAAALAIEVSGRLVELEGPVAVTAGSRAWWCGRKLRWLGKKQRDRIVQGRNDDWNQARRRPAVVRSLSDGDEVLVRGSVELADDFEDAPQEGYRASGAQYRLRRAPGESGLLLAARQEPRAVTSLAVLVASVPVWTIALLVGVLVVNGTDAYALGAARCNDWACSTYGRCGAVLTTLFPPKVDCRPTVQDHCARSLDCHQSGRCEQRDGLCVVGGDDDCRQSSGCSEDGYCSAVDSKCSATSEADCAASARCRNGASCRLAQGHCVAAWLSDCGTSFDCGRVGACSLTERGCAPDEDADCGRSMLCTEYGRCSVGNLLAGEVGCVAKGDGDCARGRACGARGQCHAREGQCVALGDGDCSASAICQYHDACRALDGRCVGAGGNPCAKTTECEERGLCTADGDLCIVGSDDDCRQSRYCKEMGLCSLYGDSCGAGSDEDCRRSSGCDFSGSCLAHEGVCYRNPPR